MDEKEFLKLLQKHITPKLTKINEEFAKLREENDALKKRIAKLETENPSVADKYNQLCNDVLRRRNNC